MPRTKEQIEVIRENRKKQIMEVATVLFAREGYGHVSIATLAKKAGISKGLMYNYFESKEQLLTDIINSGIETLLNYFDPNKDGILTEEEFVLFIKKTFQLMKDEKEYWLDFFRLLIQPNVAPYIQESSLTPFMHQSFGMFESYFRKMGFRDPALEVLNLVVILEGVGMMMVFYDGLTGFSGELYEKFEERIIHLYTSV